MSVSDTNPHGLTEWIQKDDELATIIKQLEDDPTFGDMLYDLASYYSVKDNKDLSDMNFIDDIVHEIDEDIEELKKLSQTSIDFQNLSLTEILKRIRCKCKTLTDLVESSKLSLPRSMLNFHYVSPYSSSFSVLHELDFNDDDDEIITCLKVKKALTKSLAAKLKSLKKEEINYKVVVNIFGKYANEKIKNQYSKKGMLQRRYIIQTFLDQIIKLIEEDISVKDLQLFIENFFHEIYTDAFFLDYNLQTIATWKDHERIHGKDVPAYTNEFSTIKEFAFNFVDNLLAEAVSKVDVNLLSNIDDSSESSSKESPATSIYTGIYKMELTPKEGRDEIKGIVDKWTIPKKWIYCIDFLGEESDSCTEFYKYEVKFSNPTKMYPIPQVTASVFFTIEKSRIKPFVCAPKITYNFETERYKFKPSDKIHHQHFLEDIMQSKLAFFKMIRF